MFFFNSDDCASWVLCFWEIGPCPKSWCVNGQTQLPSSCCERPGMWLKNCEILRNQNATWMNTIRTASREGYLMRVHDRKGFAAMQNGLGPFIVKGLLVRVRVQRLIGLGTNQMVNEKQRMQPCRPHVHGLFPISGVPGFMRRSRPVRNRRSLCPVGLGRWRLRGRRRHELHRPDGRCAEEVARQGAEARDGFRRAVAG